MKRALVQIVVLLLPATLAAQQDADVLRANYTKREVLVAMRDGVRLFTAIYVPNDTTRRHPIVMTRTPYSTDPYGTGRFRDSVGSQVRAYMRAAYILVYQDVRGRYMSEGEFVDVRPYVERKRSNRDTDETTDAYDTVEWLVRNVPFNNGRVGIRGTSYPGFYSSMGAIDAHAAVKVVSPQAPVTEWMGGDDFMHNGALLLSHAFDFFAGFGRARPRPTSQRGQRLDHGMPDGYAYFLRLGALANANPRVLHDSVAFWNEISRHPTWDAFWEARSARPHLRNLRPAMLWVGGWFDTENLWGALNAYAAAERQSPGAVNRLVMGPWSHGQWNRDSGDSLGSIAWGGATAQFFTDSIEVPFFNYYLLGEGQSAPREFEAAVFETGANAWRFLDAWPPRGAVPTTFYLKAGGVLGSSPPAQAGRLYDEYVSDPSRPVPYTAATTQWYDPGFMVEDQRFASRRPDVLVYQTEPLSADVRVAGPISVDFTVSTSGTDCDWVVKVIDVFPDSTGWAGERSSRRSTRPPLGGYEMLLRGDVLRGKFRGSRSTPQPFTPDSATPIRFQLDDVFHTFRSGHRIMVQVQSTWFPMIDRNPGRFLDIWQATDADFQRTTQRVFRSADHPSRVVLPVLPLGSASVPRRLGAALPGGG